MKIDSLRNKINNIDKKLLSLLEKRMQISTKIAKYKISNNKNIFDVNRENKIFKTIEDNSTKKFLSSNHFLFSTIINTGKFLQYKKIKTLPKNIEKIINISKNNTAQIDTAKLGCLEANDSYSNIAASKIFSNNNIINYTSLSDLFGDINKNIIDFGVFEISNSNPPPINNIFDLINQHDVYIYKTINITPSYCLAVNSENKNNFKKIISTSQILAQCSKYIKTHEYETSTLNLASSAAFLVSTLDKTTAVICPKEIALNNNLTIVEKDVQNSTQANKKFAVISKKLYTTKNQNILSFSIKVKNINQFLISVSSYFNINKIKLLQLQIKQSTNQNDAYTIYISFIGNIKSQSSISFINFLSQETNGFKLLGYYNEGNI